MKPLETCRRAAVLALGVALGLGGVVAGSPSANAAVSREAYIARVAPLAQAEQQKYRVPASVSIAQSMLESGVGQSKLTTRVNNYFGIKCNAKAVSPYQTGCYSIASKEFYDSREVMQVSAFRTYASAKNSFLDHGRLLTVNSRYAKAFNYTDQPDRFIAEVRKAGYATDPSYTDKVLKIMRTYNLYRFDAVPVGTTAPAPALTTVTFPTAKYGSRGAHVTTVQYLLRAHGYKVPVTGYFGTQTRGYVRAYQRKHRLAVDGVVGQRTFASLTVNVRYGSRGEAVKATQYLLRRKGVSIKVTGYYGKDTKAAVLTLQKKWGVPASGVMYNSTWTQLLR